MPQFNWLILLLSALIPLIVGFLWYNPKTFLSIWMESIGKTQDSMQAPNMVKVYLITFIMGFLAAISIQFIVIHQWHYYSILANEVGINDATSPIGLKMKEFMDQYGHNFRTFKHGAFHGTLTGIFLITPIITINALFEGRGFKYIAVNAGYWIVTIALMGGLICAYT
ncbi:MAG TPA: DUF1761 domain-containing protein [Saprospiraceae bacterium]|nr:DUF1761 domain-containing protein [Saprospiraceae bacterium]